MNELRRWIILCEIHRDIHGKPCKKDDPNRKLEPLEQLAFMRHAYPGLDKADMKHIMDAMWPELDDDQLEVLLVQAGMKDPLKH